MIRVPRRGRPFFVGGSIVLVLLIGTWVQRRPIAEGFVDNALESRGIEARYTIDDVGFTTQRLTDVVIGDPANPDLVADWIEVETNVGFGSAEVTGLSAGKVRVRGRWADGRLSLGQLDRLLPEPSGKPFALPALEAAIDDARMRLETPLGVAGLKLSGRGRLDDGFRGTLAAIAPRLAGGGCAGERVAAVLAIRIVDAAPRVQGPIEAGRAICDGYDVSNAQARVSLDLSAALDRWNGRAGVRAARVRAPLGGGRALGGSVTFAGTAARTAGRIDLAARDFAVPGASGRGLAIGGNYVAGQAIGFDGSITAERATLARQLVRSVENLRGQGTATPVGPLSDALAEALLAASRDVRVRSDVALRVDGGQGALAIARLDAAAASGARVTLSGGDGLSVRWPDAGVRIDGTLAMRGGGLPTGTVALAQARAGAPITGTARFEPYAAGGARLALTPVEFSAALDGATRIATRAVLSGPLGNGRVDGLTLPIDARWNGAGRLTVNPGCVPAGFERLAVSGLQLERAAMTLCPQGAALVSVSGGAVSGGARIATARLAGTLGGTPLTLGLSDTVFRLRDQGFTLANVEARLGAPERLSRLDIAALDGRIVGGTVAGSFSGGAGQIGNVPLLMSNAAGDWSLEGGKLALGGRLDIADAAEDARFEPVASEDFALTLIGGTVAATGTLLHPETRTEIADVAIAHELGSGTGQADLDVAGITFGPGFQPDQLTDLTFGVIADVVGTVRGKGQIRWSPDAVTSDGVFETPGTSLAAAFGPVTGIQGEIRFTDLLGLVSAPARTATIAELNPGVPIRTGDVTYQLIGDNRVAIEGGRWPFAGGALTLEPTVLDFSGEAARRMVFRVEGVDAARFLDEFDFDNLNVSGVFDGVLPMVFDADGGRIVDGRLKVRPGGGNIAYVGEVTKEDVGFWGNLAFDALKSLDYESLDLELSGPLSGEMVTAIRFAGVSQGEGTRSNFIIDRIARLPLVFNVTIRAPFRQLLDSVQSYYDPKRLIERNLPALLEQQNGDVPRDPTPDPAPIQGGESEDVP
ncbi:YdbH domain-containing protein [Sphingomonas japonica]|nr:YdbH domain-containing protein [Sphingomonas japonica]